MWSTVSSTSVGRGKMIRRKRKLDVGCIDVTHTRKHCIQYIVDSRQQYVYVEVVYRVTRESIQYLSRGQGAPRATYVMLVLAYIIMIILKALIIDNNNVAPIPIPHAFAPAANSHENYIASTQSLICILYSISKKGKHVEQQQQLQSTTHVLHRYNVQHTSTFHRYTKYQTI